MYHTNLLSMPFPKQPLIKMIAFKKPVLWPVKVYIHLTFFNFEQRLTALLKIQKKIKCMQTLTGRHSSFKKAIILTRGCFENGMDRRFAWYISFPLYTYFSLSN